MKLIRENSMGLAYELEDKYGDTLVKMNNKRMIFNMPIEEMSNRWYRWQMLGEFIQKAFDNCTAEQREFLMTGITPKEWNEIFKDE